MHTLRAKQSSAFTRTSTMLQQAIRLCYILSFVSISEVNTAKSVILDIPPRIQWANEHGYCAETSLQAIGLYYGCWMSQQLIRSINQKELLITDDDNDKSTITKLLFNFEQWQFNKETQPQFKNYSAWLKKHLIQGHPCIIVAYVNDADNDPTYDHIMPAIGIRYQTEYSYDSNDTLLFYDLFQLRTLERELSTNDMIKTRQMCKKSTIQGGCLPYYVDYGYTILGIKDQQKATLLVRLKIDKSNEPNLSLGASPILMQGTVTVFNLAPGRNYVLLRYKSYTEVPSSGNAKTFLTSKYYKRYNFKATNCTYTYTDPEKIPSNGATYYRCVLAP